MPKRSANLAHPVCGFFDTSITAVADGRMAGEIVAVEVPRRKQDPLIADTDEHPRQTSLEKLAALRPLFPDGTITAGNASGINDGAAAVVNAVGLYVEEGAATFEAVHVEAAGRVAEAVRDGLDPRLKAYVEYSNEVWNRIFPQAGWAAAQAKQSTPSSVSSTAVR